MINQFYIDYIKAIENPDRIGWNGKVWIAPQYKGYDKNQRGYGIDIVKNDSARRLTQNRPGQWLTEEEADKLMKEHLLYVYGAALKHIKGFDNLSDRRKAALLGMLYRGDSVNENRHIININEPDDNKFFESISNYYKSKGLNERARNSSNFFNNNQLIKTNFLIPMKWEQWEPPMKFKSGGQVRIKNAKNGIHIKEKNKGSFTRWCGGNVTEECIRRGKNSSNPKIRKKATFADNARKWKHLLGGNIVIATPEMIKNHYQGEITLGKTFKDKVFDVGNALGLFIPFVGTALDTKENQTYAAVSGGIRDIAIPGFIKWGNSKDTSKRIRGWDRRRKRNPNYGKPMLPTKFMRGAAKTLGVAGLILDTPNIVSDIENLKRTLGFNYNHLLLMKEKKGGKAFVSGVNVLDSNPDAYKHVKKKVKMRLYGGPIPWEITWINNNPSITDANRIFKHNNSILQLTDEYNNLKLLELKEINKEAQKYYGSFKELELLFGYLNKPKANNSTYSNPTYYNTTLEPKLVYSNGNQFKGGMLNTDPKTFFNL